MSRPDGRLAAPVPRWVITLSRLDEADTPLTAWEAMKIPGEEYRAARSRVRPDKRMQTLRRAGLVSQVICDKGWKRWDITVKGRQYLRDALLQMSEFLRGDW